MSVSIPLRDPLLSSLYHTRAGILALGPCHRISSPPSPYIAFFEVYLGWFAKGFFGGERGELDGRIANCKQYLEKEISDAVETQYLALGALMPGTEMLPNPPGVGSLLWVAKGRIWMRL